MNASRLRVAAQALPRHISKRTFTATARQLVESGSGAPTTSTARVPTSGTEAPSTTAALQAPNRADVWSRSQQPRNVAMTGPRFEQTDLDLQPRPYAAIELIHKQPVRWTHDRIVACDGGGGPTGHPKIYINLDKPQIEPCTYCGLPFANEHHRKHLESLPETSYPLA
ncbi:lactobacillus shifted protein [Cladorrhinum samala]|uniref:Lactobacillus shifted protein n=1 Tax=Cladorrhinum samala TaxID=585594 RepID=A0AAV9HID8_9PEZI|nr:lactobacillus shifted protein [Cladorrhinum samala]